MKDVLVECQKGIYVVEMQCSGGGGARELETRINRGESMCLGEA